MISNVLNTFGSKILIAIISFSMLSLNAHFLGPSGLGTIGLIILGVTIVQLAANLINGSIIYFSSRLLRGNLILIAYLWSLVSVMLFAIINEAVELFEPAYANHIYLLSLLQAFISIHLYVLLGDEKVKSFNLFSLLQSIITIGFLLVAYLIREEIEVMAFVKALYTAYSVVLLLSGIAALKKLKLQTSSLLDDFKQCIRYGFFIQTANTFQLLNYRLSYFILDAYTGRAALGLYTASIQLSEALLIPGRSIATVQYARISAKDNDQYAQRITFLFMKLSFLVTLIGSIVLLSLPTSVYEYFLGSEFSQVKLLIICMGLGLISLSAEIILSHYFSGTGRQEVNSTSAAIGLAVTIVAAFTLIPTYGAVGAAVSTALSYCSMFLFLFIKMNFQKGVSSIQFLPNKNDLKLLRRLLKI